MSNSSLKKDIEKLTSSIKKLCKTHIAEAQCEKGNKPIIVRSALLRVIFDIIKKDSFKALDARRQVMEITCALNKFVELNYVIGLKKKDIIITWKEK